MPTKASTCMVGLGTECWQWQQITALKIIPSIGRSLGIYVVGGSVEVAVAGHYIV